MKRNHTLFINDILEAINKIEEFVGDMNYEKFTADDKTVSVVIRKLEIIGEAAKNLPEFLKEKYPLLPWKEMARMRDKITHGYFEVDYEIVWKVIKERLPEIKPLTQQILNRIKNSPDNVK